MSESRAAYDTASPPAGAPVSPPVSPGVREVWHEPAPLGRRILDYVRMGYTIRGVAPTIEEIKTALALSSTSLVVYWLDKLERQGKIERIPHTTRSIVVRVAGGGQKTARSGSPSGSPVATDGAVGVEGEKAS